METAMVFSRTGTVLFWHLPPDRSQGAIPDSRDLWERLWRDRMFLGGIAHTHPWDGEAWMSHTDVTTFAALEAGLGKRLVWPIVTFTEVGYFEWAGPDRLDYTTTNQRRFRLDFSDIEHLRDLSR